MEYKGRKIGFRRSVASVAELEKIAPGGQIERIGELFSAGDLGTSIEKSAQFLAIMNKWYENSLVFEIEGYKPDPIPIEWFLCLDPDEFTEILNDALRQFGIDDETTVEAVDFPGKKNE